MGEGLSRGKRECQEPKTWNDLCFSLVVDSFEVGGAREGTTFEESSHVQNRNRRYLMDTSVVEARVQVVLLVQQLLFSVARPAQI